MGKKHPNILIFAIDSIRRDHMSCYGYERLTTPHFDRIAANGLLFENAFSAHIPTTPAYSTLLTGCDIFSHRQVSLGPKGPLPEDRPTLPEILREAAGYRSTVVGFDKGFFRGFDEYLNFEGWASYPERPARKAENLNDVALPALEEMDASGQPWLLFLRHMDPHAPYLPPAPFDSMFYSADCCDPANKSMEPVFAFEPFADFLRSWMPPGVTDKDYVIAQYDGALAYMDACCRRIFQRLDELGCYEDTLITITGDHGETLYDHEIYFDHHGLYEPTLTTPLIFHWPGHVPAGKRSEAIALHQDLLPTLLEVCGLHDAAAEQRFDGVSLHPYFEDLRGTPRSEFYITECTWMRKHGWRTPVWKFWDALEPDFHGKPPVELYNLVEDPEEAHNLAEAMPEVVELLRGRMNAWLARREQESGQSNPLHEHEIGLERRIGSISTAKKLQER